MPDAREQLASAITRVGGPLCWLARFVTSAAVCGSALGVLLWWIMAAERIGDWWIGTLEALILLALLLAPAAWLLNVRLALKSLVELPAKLQDVADRRGPQLRHLKGQRPRGGAIAAMRSIRGVAADYGEVVGSWGVVAQLVTPSFWLLTSAALLSVPVLAALCLIAGFVRLLT